MTVPVQDVSTRFGGASGSDVDAEALNSLLAPRMTLERVAGLPIRVVALPHSRFDPGGLVNVPEASYPVNPISASPLYGTLPANGRAAGLYDAPRADDILAAEVEHGGGVVTALESWQPRGRSRRRLRMARGDVPNNDLVRWALPMQATLVQVAVAIFTPPAPVSGTTDVVVAHRDAAGAVTVLYVGSFGPAAPPSSTVFSSVRVNSTPVEPGGIEAVVSSSFNPADLTKRYELTLGWAT